MFFPAVSEERVSDDKSRVVEINGARQSTSPLDVENWNDSKKKKKKTKNTQPIIRFRNFPTADRCQHRRRGPSDKYSARHVVYILRSISFWKIVL